MKRKILLQRLLGYLSLNEVGFVEMVFALSLLLSGFSLGPIHLSYGIWAFLWIIIFIQGKISKIHFYPPLLIFVIYWLLHTIVIILIDEVNINAIIEQIIFFLSIFIIYPHLNFNRLKGSLNWIALIAIGGLLYQWSMITSGTMVHQLELPGLTLPSENLEVLSIRPSSFFQEPAAYVAFMVCPLALALKDRKYVWAVVMILSIFLTTSTTGIFASFILLTVSLFTSRKFSIKTIIAVGLLITAMYFALTKFEVFEYGVEKLEEVDTETNVRLTQGPYVVSTMDSSELLFGAPYSSAYSYCKAGRAPQAAFYGETVYMSTFWQMILLYGIVGLILYINVYYHIFKKSRETWPMLAFLCIVLFSSGYGIGVIFTFTTVFLLVLSNNYNSISDYKK